MSYYDEKLSAERLRRCYEIAPPAVQRYLQAEIDFVCRFVNPGAPVLELGCGYGRVLAPLCRRSPRVVGIDRSLPSLRLARSFVPGAGRVPPPPACVLIRADAADLPLAPNTVDLVVCIQNGLAAMDAPPDHVLREAVRVTRPGGRLLFSSYADRFWPHRLAWFRLQADHGLIGAIDEGATGDGTIVCRDGLRLSTMRAEAFRALLGPLGLSAEVHEVAASSLFFEITLGNQA